MNQNIDAYNDQNELNWVDAHAHTWSEELKPNYQEIMDRAWASGISEIIEVGVNVPTSKLASKLASTDHRIHAVCGIHPHDADKYDQQYLDLQELSTSGNFVAIGEIGLDFYRNFSPPEQQYKAFKKQLELARISKLPVVIHSRNADMETYSILKNWVMKVGKYLGISRPIGMLHCFSGNSELSQKYQDLGFLISLAGPVTYKNNIELQKVAKLLPLSKMLIETDCPYLTPTPYRGKLNEPAYVKATGIFIANIKNKNIESVAKATTENAKLLFEINGG